MNKIALLFILLATSACSSGGSVQGKSLSELRAACGQGNSAACRTVKQHDQLL
ncbi:hypothetical protein RM190_11140 [Paracoccus sp. CPCC 101403]|uniref:Lipoprotein n=2 Tax=Paracoccus broussonetiae TaxID=3075834 RepID=A0ABU3EDV7_9RHOB|nr:hypothetical protein [Paracoccus sp. CPCC 101403]MDT1062419.1 hypothetical protein [Paracoccus sp. CPCC 101403]